MSGFEDGVLTISREFEISDYQVLMQGSKQNFFSTESSATSVKVSIQMTLDDILPVATEKRQFECRHEINYHSLFSDILDHRDYDARTEYDSFSREMFAAGWKRQLQPCWKKSSK